MMAGDFPGTGASHSPPSHCLAISFSPSHSHPPSLSLFPSLSRLSPSRPPTLSSCGGCSMSPCNLCSRRTATCCQRDMWFRLPRTKYTRMPRQRASETRSFCRIQTRRSKFFGAVMMPIARSRGVGGACRHPLGSSTNLGRVPLFGRPIRKWEDWFLGGTLCPPRPVKIPGSHSSRSHRNRPPTAPRPSRTTAVAQPVDRLHIAFTVWGRPLHFRIIAKKGEIGD